MSSVDRRLSDIVDDHEVRIVALEKNDVSTRKALDNMVERIPEYVEQAIVNAAKRAVSPKMLSKILSSIASFIVALYALIQAIQKVM